MARGVRFEMTEEILISVGEVRRILQAILMVFEVMVRVFCVEVAGAVVGGRAEVKFHSSSAGAAGAGAGVLRFRRLLDGAGGWMDCWNW